MAPGFRKFAAIAGGLLIAAAIAYWPWSYRDDISAETDAFYWMTAILWAPTALIVGVGAGLWFGFRRWPRKRRDTERPPERPRAAERSSFEA